MVLIKEKDKRLLEFGKQAESHLETKGYKCVVKRPWNNEYELSLHKPGDFDTIHTEILALLIELGFTPQNADTDRCVYANLKEGIGCVVDEDRHYISLSSDYKVS